MTRETAPPGKTFAERWPHDASEREYLVASSVPFVLGGLAGLFAVPSMLALVFLLAPLVLSITVAATLALSWIVIRRSEARSGRWVVRAWKLGAWVTLAVVLGLLLSVLGTLLCGGSCSTVGRFERPLATVLTFALSIAGALAITFGVERAARRISVRDRATGRR